MISIILPTYCPAPDVVDKLKTCLNSLYETIPSMKEHELIVVEQGERHAEKILVPETLDHAYTYVSYNKPVGFSEAVNAGVRLAHGDYYAIINNDLVFQYDWLNKMQKVYESNPKIGLLSPIDQHHAIEDHEYVDSWWSCVLISKTVWDRVGELNTEQLRYRFHDQDWSIRCAKQGFSVMRTKRVRVYHDDGSTYRHMKPSVDEGAEARWVEKMHGYRHFIDWVSNHHE